MAAYAVFVDAGFLKAEGAKSLGSRAQQVRLSAAAVVSWARQLSLDGGQFLRVYWYDAEFDHSDRR